MQEENGGITFREIFKTIWLRKWVALIVAVAVALIMAVSLYYGYNRSRESYMMEFSLNLPGDDNGVVYNYPNGSQLYYTDMTSLPTLRAVKNANQAFSDIDVEEMATKGRINIERNIKTLVDDNGSISAYREITYTITAKSDCFSNANQAKDFLMQLASTPKEYLKTMEIDYGVYLNNYDAAGNYEKEIELLKNQLNVLSNGYAGLISSYGQEVVIGSGKTLFAYSQNVKTYADSNELDNLLTEVKEGKILKSEDCKNDYGLEAIRVKEQLDDATTTLNKLTTSDKAFLDGASVIKAQQDLVNELTRRLTLVEAFKNGTVNPDFETNVEAAKAKVQALTDEYSEVSATVYNNASSVVYVQPGIIETVGGMSLSKVLILSVIVAIVVALIAAYVAGYYKLKALKTAENTVTEEPEKADIVAADTVEKTDENEQK